MTLFLFSILQQELDSVKNTKMNRNVFEVFLSVKKSKREKAYRENHLTLIVSIICALLNSNGGELNVKYEDDAILGDAEDGILRMIEQHLINFFGSCVFHAMVRVLKNAKQLVFTVDSSQALCTVDYHFYLPTQDQIISISSWQPPESVKAILNREVGNQNQFENDEDFVLNRQVPFRECDFIRFKLLKSEESKCISFADRMTNKRNKLGRYISAFAKKKGGHIFCGIKGDGVVKGQVIREECQHEIVSILTKAINKMIWCGGQLERGRHWDIQFAPVKDESQNEIPSLSVVIISVVPLRGGLFTNEPESYYVVQSQVRRMPFSEWRCRFFADEESGAAMDKVPSVVDRLNIDDGESNIESSGKLMFIILLK